MSPSPILAGRGVFAPCRLLLLLLGLLLFAGASARADEPKPNIFGGNAGFEQNPRLDDNLWDGVDSDGFLHGPTFSAQVVTERSGLGSMAMPASVAFVDLNGDNLPDLIAADPTGYIRYYQNSGTATAPKFTNAEIIPLFAAGSFEPGKNDSVRFCPRISLADWRHTGLLDLMIGNYFGEILFIPNSGSHSAPVFKLPTGGVLRARVPTNDQGRFWANLLSPVGVDWNGDGKLDLIAGEGTYSANSIHLFENIGSGDSPKFTSAKHTYLAYGEGREQLIPTVVDYDGDGNPDLVVADRTGEVGVYLSPGKPKVGVELTRASTISFGGASKLPGLVSPYAADYNGDGLFDLIFGLPNGRIAVALNTGTKGNPTFGPLEDIKGTDRLGRNINSPIGWSPSTFPQYGNALAYFSVVNVKDEPDLKPPQGAQALKAGFWPALGQVFPMPVDGMPGADRHMSLHRGLALTLNKTYHISFKVKGAGMRKCHWGAFSHYEGYPGLAKVEKNERGGVRKSGDYVSESVEAGADFNMGNDWQTVEGTITPHYKSPLLKDVKTISMAFTIEFYATNLASVGYFDDFQLTMD